MDIGEVPFRRRMAVLFADLSGFTKLVETVAPEQVYNTVKPLLDELVLLVRLHDGEVQQVLGDGFMCVFDDATTAVRCGLALVAAGRPELPVHVGVEYGEVLVTPTWERAAYGVWGRAVNHAQRLCDQAGPGGLLVGPAAHTAAGRVGLARPVRVELAGIAHPVLAHAVYRDVCLAA